MLIVCPNCATSYRVEASSLGTAGRSVRCVRCRNIWFARDGGGLPAIARAHRRDVATMTGAVLSSEEGELPESLAEAPVVEAPQPVPEEPFYRPGTDIGLDALEADIPGSAGELTDSLPQPAEPIAVTEAPSLAPIEVGAAPRPNPAVGEDIETFAARRARSRAGERPRPPISRLALAILALLALDAALIGWRAGVVRLLPQTASLYAAVGLPVNLRGLSFLDVTSAAENQDGVQVLVIEGTIASVSARPVEVPRLRFSVRNRRGQEVYAWTALPERTALAAGETLKFRSRLASPPADARDVLVRFFHRRDLMAGAR